MDTQTQTQDELLNQTQAARLIGITRAAMSYALKRNLIAFEAHGPCKLIRRSAAEYYRTHRPRPGRRR